MTEAIVGLVGVLIGAFISWATTTQSEKRRNAVALYTEFASPDMEKIRYDATNFLRSNIKAPQPLTFQEMHEHSDASDLTAVSRLLNFWEKTWYLVCVSYIDEHLTKEFLRHYFENHYKYYLAEFVELCETRPDEPNFRKWALAVRNLAKRWRISSSPYV